MCEHCKPLIDKGIHPSIVAAIHQAPPIVMDLSPDEIRGLMNRVLIDGRCDLTAQEVARLVWSVRSYFYMNCGFAQVLGEIAGPLAPSLIFRAAEWASQTSDLEEEGAQADSQKAFLERCLSGDKS